MKTKICYLLSLLLMTALGTVPSFAEDDDATLAANLDQLISDYKALTITTGENPGMTPASAVATFTAAISEAETEAAASTTTAEKAAISKKLTKAYETCINTVNPIVNGGIYYIVNDNSKIAAAGKEDKAMYINVNDKSVCWAKKVAGDDTYAFQVTVNNDGTYNLKNIKTGLYTGSATAFCGKVAASSTPVDLLMHCYPGTGSYYIKGAAVNGVSWTYCPQGNADGTNDGPNNVWAYNGETTPGGDVAHAEWTWRLEPFYDADALATIVADCKTKAQGFVGGNCANMVEASVLEAFSTAITEAEAALTNCTTAENAALYPKLQSAYQACLSAINPLVNGGVYYLVNDNSKIAAAGKEDKAMYVEANKKTVRWATKTADCAYAFQITVNDDGTYYLKNVYTGLYAGSSTAMYGTVPVSSTPVKLTMHGYSGTGSYYIKGAAVNGVSWTYCPQGNADGTNDGPNNVWAYNGETTPGGDVAHTEWTWRLEPYYSESSLDELITKYKALTIVTGENPGTIPASAVETFNTAIATAETAAAAGGTAEEKIAASLALDEAYGTCLNTINPIVNGGIYYIVNDNSKIAAAGKEDKAMYINANDKTVCWAKKVAGDDTYAFQVTVNDDGTCYFKNLKTGLYTGSGSYITTAAASSTPSPVTPHCYIGTGSYYIKDAAGWTYCPQGNGNGTNDGPNTVWGWNGETTSGGDMAHLEWTWRLEPFYDADALDELITDCKTRAQEFTGGDNPGMVAASTLEAFNTAITEAEAAFTSSTTAENAALYPKLKNAYQACVNAINPIVNGGIYYIVNDNSKIAAAGKEDKAMYVDASAKTVRWAKKVANDDTYAFLITVNDDGTYYFKNIKTGLYTGSSTGPCSTVPASSSPVKLTMHCYSGTGSYYIKGEVVNNTAWTYCPQGNADGTKDGPMDVWSWNGETTSGGDVAHAEWTWRLVPYNNISFSVKNGSLVASGNNISTTSITSAMSDNTTITSLDLSAATLADAVTADELTSALTGNQVAILPATSTLEGQNLVVDGKCSNLVLTDKANFAPATEFTATKVTYQKTGLDGAGWYSAVLPYSITVPEGMTVLNNATMGEGSISFDQIEAGSTIAANTPFLYKTASNTVVFETSNATISTAETMSSGDLLGTYITIAAGDATGKLILNTEGSAFATATDKASIPAFRAYLNASAKAKEFTIVINGETTGIASGEAINGTNQTVDVYTVGGTLVRTHVDAMTALQGLPKGIYIVNGKKIIK